MHHPPFDNRNEAIVGIAKAVTIHTLRHSYCLALTDARVSLRAVQEAMGHEDPRTTALYTQLPSSSQNDTERRINALTGRLRLNWGE